MATEKEVESFIYKVNQLWRGGFAADLQFKCNAGQVYINLKVGLGYAPRETNDSKSARKHIYPFVSSGYQRSMLCVFYTGAILCSVVVSYQDDRRRRRQV